MSRNKKKEGTPVLLGDYGTDRRKSKVDDAKKQDLIKIVVPDSLKQRLASDHDHVHLQEKVVSLPKKPTVYEILESYKTYKLSNTHSPADPEVLIEVIHGMRLYFDKTLSNQLLYNGNEKKQYTKQMRNIGGQQDTLASNVYGAEHLLRLFVNLPTLLAETYTDNETIEILKSLVSDLLLHIEANGDKYFGTEYE
ncbi:hypothetical protein SeLEV6574_g01850 [Synchytrium endobioticum]|nr:hypothetical protein SeLEV6574_g01850 [Synchytrium endobioticum]